MPTERDVVIWAMTEELEEARAELERLRPIERRARGYLDNPGRYDEDDISTARYILTGESS